MKGYRLYRRNIDDETRTIWWEWIATFAEREEAERFGKTLAQRINPFRGYAVRAPGEPKPKAGHCSKSEQARLLRDDFGNMCREEQEAYLGR